MGIGSITFSVPHFISGPYMAGHSASSNASVNNMCRNPNAAFGRGGGPGSHMVDDYQHHRLRHHGGYSGSHPAAVGSHRSGRGGVDTVGGVAVAAAAGGAAPEDIAAVEGLLETLPGLDKIKSLTEGEI